jgi:hypothetical protein
MEISDEDIAYLAKDVAFGSTIDGDIRDIQLRAIVLRIGAVTSSI